MGIVFGFLASFIRGAADDIKHELLLVAHNRALCDFDGDLKQLQTRLDVNKIAFLERRKIFGK